MVAIEAVIHAFGDVACLVAFTVANVVCEALSRAALYVNLLAIARVPAAESVEACIVALTVGEPVGLAAGRARGGELRQARAAVKGAGGHSRRGEDEMDGGGGWQLV